MTEAHELYKFTPGRKAVIVNVPHAGTVIPADIAANLTSAGRAVPDTDWHVERLYTAALQMGCAMMVATHSRIVVDLNRDPAGATLYPGASNTELCPTSTFADEPIYLEGKLPDTHEIERRRRAYWQPYHDKLGAEIDAIKAKHGHCILLDAHSIRSFVPRFFEGKLPDLNLGTADGKSCSPELAAKAFGVLQGAVGFTAVHNGRFKGGYITRHYGQPAANVHALQLEIGQTCYMDEAAAGAYDAAASAPLKQVLGQLAASLVEAKFPG
jgi:N-formylglutamate deformylase